MKKRTGVIVKKLGMSHIFREGEHIPVTVLQLEECHVIGVRTKEKNNYWAVQIGVGTKPAHRVSKAGAGLFFKEGLPIKKKLAEFRVDDVDGLVEIGARILPTHFIEGQYVDVTGITIGRGFTGVMKRHGFHGLRASHGVSLTHRSLGSTGQNQDPGRVQKNKKMPGRYGGHRKTILNLIIESIDIDLGIICVRGATMGFEDSYLYLRDSIKKKNRSARNGQLLDLPFPASVAGPETPTGGETLEAVSG